MLAAQLPGPGLTTPEPNKSLAEKYGAKYGKADTARLMVFKLVMAAARTWRRLKGESQLPKIVQGVTFHNGVEVTSTPAQSAA